MSRVQTREQRLLEAADQYLLHMAPTHAQRLQLLEAAAAAKSRCDVREYWKAFDITAQKPDDAVIRKLTALLESSDVPFSMAVSSLAREPLQIEQQKKNGVFYTDYRLASFLAQDCSHALREETSVADFAAGMGILLAGVAMQYQQKFPASFDAWIAGKLYAFDLSALALRGACAAMLALTGNIPALKSMTAHWKTTDSLLDDDVSAQKFDVIVGNPPWGRIKLSRHDFLTRNGEQRVYGAEYGRFDADSYQKTKSDLSQYAQCIRQKYPLLGNAEPDMYMAFLQRVIESAAEGGHISYLVPAGLIRSQGTQALRRYLLQQAGRLEFTLLDNQADYFSIDSRFKFVLLSFEKVRSAQTAEKAFYFSMAADVEGSVAKGCPIQFSTAQLEALRPDLTVPEVRSEAEKRLFFKVCQNGKRWGQCEGLWYADISREVDMTKGRERFTTCAQEGGLPVVEGRMVQQYRFGAKTYCSGSGRSAKWAPCSTGAKPQFYYPLDAMSRELRARTAKLRAGYCDIAGQTNERGMMSAVIPPDVVCGNKVPTILFPHDETGELLYLWIGVTNSFVFDWMIRRIISTTVNYFLLFSIPMPDISVTSELAQRIIRNTKRLSAMQADYYTSSEMARLRSEIDVCVAEAYGLGTEDMELVLADFPLLDRRQPPLPQEERSTVTRDLVLSQCEQQLDGQHGAYWERYKKAQAGQAQAYIPTEMTELSKGGA